MIFIEKKDKFIIIMFLFCASMPYSIQAIQEIVQRTYAHALWGIFKAMSNAPIIPVQQATLSGDLIINN